MKTNTSTSFIRRTRTALVVATLARAVLVIMAASACSINPPAIEFRCGKPAWTDYQGDSTTYSITFETGAVAMPWDCSAIVSFDIYDTDGYVHAAAAYVLDIDATVEPSGWETPSFQRAEHAFTIDLEHLISPTPRGSTSYTSRLRGIRTIVPRDVVFQPDNTLLYPAWWRLPFEAVDEEGSITGYVADSLPD